MTRAARERANWGRYYDQTDPALSHEERSRLAESLRREHMARMGLASAGKPRRRRPRPALDLTKCPICTPLCPDTDCACDCELHQRADGTE